MKVIVLADGDAPDRVGLDLAWPSWAEGAEVVVAAEEKFDVKIPDDEVKNLKTVGDAVAFIERAQNG